METKIYSFIKSIIVLLAFFFCYAILSSYLAPTINNNYAGNIVQLLLSIILIKYFFKDLKENAKHFSFKKSQKYITIFLIASILTYLINLLLEKHLGFMVTNEYEVRQYIINFPINGLLSSVIFAPFYEELITRLNFRKAFSNKWTFIIVSSLIFSSIHLISISNSLELLYIIPYMCMSIALGYIYYDSNCIYISMLYHLLNNLIQILLIFGGVL